MFYQGFRDFWVIDSRQADTTDMSVFNVTQWKEHWGVDELYPLVDQVVWRQPLSSTKPAHRRLLSEFLLADSSLNPAKGGGEDGASDGRDAGALYDELGDFATEEVMDGDEESRVRTPE